jgi:ribonuclease Z
MMKICFLGTASASVTAARDNISLLVQSGQDILLFECAGNPAGKILRAGFNPNDLKAVFLTHLHIDHCYGLPALIFHMFLQKRTQLLDVFGPEEESDLIHSQLQSHGINGDMGTFSVNIIPVSYDSNRLVYKTDHTAVYSAPANHSRATRAFRIHERKTGKTFVYTGDTAPVDDLADFSQNVDLLVHEATYLEKNEALAAEYGHSTASQAARIAQQANAASLALVHLECSSDCALNDYRIEAQKHYKGHIHIPDDLTTLSL